MSGMRLAKVLEWMFLPYANDMTIGRIELGKSMLFLQRGNYKNFLSVGFYVKSKLELVNVDTQKLEKRPKNV